MKKNYIGLDVSMKRTFICVINHDGKIIHEGSEKTDPLFSFTFSLRKSENKKLNKKFQVF